MIRHLFSFALIVLVTVAAPATFAAAATTVAASQPSQPLAAAMSEQAFALMVKGDYRGAAALLEKVCKDTPPAQRNRALVINRAIVDITQKTLVMRAVKEMTEYLTKHRDPDEYATNVLGCALDIAASSQPRLKSGDVWQTAFREWDRRNYVLDHGRAGYRRWGTQWVTSDEFQEIERQREGLKQSIADQGERVDRANLRAASLAQQLQNAVTERDTNRWLMDYLRTYGQSGGWNPRVGPTPQDLTFVQPQIQQFAMDAVQAEVQARRLGPEMNAAIAEFNQEARKLAELQNRVIRPSWPTKFDPVDPTGPEADKPPALPPPDPSAATQPAPRGGLQPLPPARGGRAP